MASEELIVRADDPRLLLENVFHQEGEGGRVHFDRCYDRQYGCEGGALSQHPGATISFLTDAESGVLTLQYNEQCDESCPGTMPDGCYHPKSMCVDQHEGLCGTCRAYCAPKLYIAGERITLPPLVARSSYNQGEVKLAIFKQSSRSAVPRRFDIVMPWAADVSFVGLRLRNVKQLKQPRRLTFRYVAYGDSITHGFCADTPYPEHIARENGWSALNLGIGGISITPHHGGALADLKPDLISTLIGTNNWPWDCDVSAKMAQFLDNIRHRLQHVPIVVVTPITRGEEGELNAKRCATLEDTREQIRRVVARRQRAGDNRIFLVEGRPLLPMYHLHDRLHPGDSSAMRDLGLNLNAQMGFSKVQYTVSPDCPDLKVHAHGLTPGGRSALYYGNHMVNTDIAASDGCIGRTLMIGGHLKGRISRTANEMGQATFSLQDIEAGHNCATAFFQILDFVTCVTSKVGLGSEGRDSLDDTAAEVFPIPPLPPIVQPSPVPAPIVQPLPIPTPPPKIREIYSPPPSPRLPAQEPLQNISSPPKPKPSSSVLVHTQMITFQAVASKSFEQHGILPDWLQQLSKGADSPLLLVPVAVICMLAGVIASLCVHWWGRFFHRRGAMPTRRRSPHRRRQRGTQHELVSVHEPEGDV